MSARGLEIRTEELERELATLREDADTLAYGLLGARQREGPACPLCGQATPNCRHVNAATRIAERD